MPDTRMIRTAFLILLELMLFFSTTSFVVLTTHRSTFLKPLFVKKQAKPKTGGGGFGGPAQEPCPCGSAETYSRCCGKIHKDVNAYKSATAEQIARARYSAYAKKQADFLMATTHPLHKDFNTDLKQWKEQIKLNMYDNFDMKKCLIVEADEQQDIATVKFVAELQLRSTGEITGFQETSLFERAKTHRGWMYKNGTMEAAPEDLLVKNLETNKQ